MPIASRFRHTITISRWTEGGSTSARGRRNDTWVDDTETTLGNIQGRSGRELTDETGNIAVTDAIGFLAIDTVISARDRIKMGGSTYQVVGPPRDAGGRGRHLELDLRLVIP